MISVKGTIILVIMLFVPLCLTILGAEPYPAIILPYGGGVYRQQDHKIQISYKAVYGVDGHGQWKEIEPVSFMKPIPYHYFPYLAGISFGFDTLAKNHRDVRIYKFLGLKKKDRKRDYAEMTSWLRNRLTANQMRDSTMKVVTYTETISTDTRKLLAKEIVNERIINLY